MEATGSPGTVIWKDIYSLRKAYLCLYLELYDIVIDIDLDVDIEILVESRFRQPGVGLVHLDGDSLCSELLDEASGDRTRRPS